MIVHGLYNDLTFEMVRQLSSYTGKWYMKIHGCDAEDTAELADFMNELPFLDHHQTLELMSGGALICEFETREECDACYKHVRDQQPPCNLYVVTVHNGLAMTENT